MAATSEPKIGLRRPPLRQLTGVQIIGTGSYVPDNVVTNDDLASLGCDSDWIIQRTGIRERRHAPKDMCTSDLATRAAERAIEAAGIDRSEIDLCLLGTFSPDQPIPQTATTVQMNLGLNCPATDLAAACAGFAYSLVFASQFVATGCSKYALVIGADTNSRLLDPTDVKTYPLFGDGAGAVILTRGSDEQGMLSYTLGADGAGSQLLVCPMGGSKEPFHHGIPEGQYPWLVKMEGRPIFKWAVRLLEDSFAQVLEGAGVAQEDVKLWLLHQANKRIIDAATSSCGIDPERVPIHLDRYGNTSGGSIPIALDEAFRAGRIDPGDRLMFCGFGAGLSWGTILWRW